MAWCVHKAGGAGPVFQLKATVSGNTKVYLWLSCMSSISGSWATLACKIPDFTRYARSSRGQYIQLPFLPLILTFMSGYAIFLGPIGSILCADFWLVKKQNIDVPALYDPAGRYRYWRGINWRALLAFIVSCTPNIPGLIATIASFGGSTSIYISAGAKHLYTFNFLFGFMTSVVVYTFLSLIFPSSATMIEETIYGYELMIGGVDVENEKGFDNDDVVGSVTKLPTGGEKAGRRSATTVV